ncbi:DUF4148 domain-containing protein [Caldimonas sp. KR1-144]|uniref:DUF4148 domain-containing protein n=1 Tax=Caldimonas sp. KR1-144 TaxID=3400911 RepID=UPI003C09168F
MNRQALIAALAVALLGASPFASAQDGPAPKTRADVQAEVAAARAAGRMDFSSREVSLPPPVSWSLKSGTRGKAAERDDGRDALARGEPGQGAASR